MNQEEKSTAVHKLTFFNCSFLLTRNNFSGFYSCFSSIKPGILTIIFTLFFLFGIFSSVSAQQVRFFTNKNQLTTDEILEISVEISGVSRVNYPSFPQMEQFASRGQSTSQNFGPSGSKITFTQSYQPLKPGKYQVPAVSVIIGGKTYSSEPLTVSITKGNGNTAQKNQGRNNRPDDFFSDPFNQFFSDPYNSKKQEPLKFTDVTADAFLSVELNKNECYVGEQLLCEVILFINRRDEGKIRVDGMEIANLHQRIRNRGFWEEKIDFTQIPIKQVTINGKPYNSYVLYRSVLFPTEAGKINFDDIYLEAKKLQVANNASIFDKFSGSDKRFENIKIKARSATLQVKSLPEHRLKPVATVGRFTFSGGLTPDSVSTGEPVELKIKLKGNGNAALISAPEIYSSPELETYEPGTSYFINKNEQTVFGENVFSYQFVPKSEGKHQIGPFVFYYFDPIKRAYDSLTSSPYYVYVTGGNLMDLKVNRSAPDKFYLKRTQGNEGMELSRNFWNSYLWFLVLLIPAGVFIYIRFLRKS